MIDRPPQIFGFLPSDYTHVFSLWDDGRTRSVSPLPDSRIESCKFSSNVGFARECKVARMDRGDGRRAIIDNRLTCRADRWWAVWGDSLGTCEAMTPAIESPLKISS